MHVLRASDAPSTGFGSSSCPGRSEEGARALIEKALDPVQQFMVCGVAMDMSAPFQKAVRSLLPNADIVFDKRVEGGG